MNLFVKEEKKEEFISYGSDWSRFLGKKEMPTVQYKSAFYEYNGFDNEVKGCTADGKSELLFVFNSSFDNRTLNVSYYKDKGGPTSSWPLIEEYKQVAKNIDEELNFIGNRRGIVFTAPDDFNDNSSSYRMQVRVIVEPFYCEEYDCTLVSSKEFVSTFEIWRPAVLLVHGLWSNKDALVPLQTYLKERGIYKNDDHVFCADYKATHSESFYDNTHKYKVIHKNMKAVHDSLYHKHGIISYSYDLVGHSMGGILSRLYAGLGAEERSHVNRIITLNTPHSGSQWADFVEDVSMNLNLIDLDFMNIEKSLLLNSLFLIAKNYWIANFPMAVDGLAVSNGPINNYLNWGSNLCKGVPVHSVVTYLNTPPSLPDEVALFLDFRDLIEKLNPIGTLKEAFKNLINNNIKIPSNPYQIGMLLSSEAGKYELNDLVVPFTSQTGGLITPNTHMINSPWLDQGFIPASHVSSCGYEDVQAHIAECLLASKHSDYYSMDGFKPRQLHYTWSEANLKTRSADEDSSASNENLIYDVSDTSILKFSDVKVEDNVLSFHVIKGDDVKSNSVIGAGKNSFAFWDSDKDTYSFELPRVFDDDVDLVVFGVNNANELVIDSISLHIKTALSPERIVMTHSKENISLYQGSSVFLGASAIWSDGYEETVKPVFTADNDEVIIRDFEVIGYKPGKTVIKAEYAGCVDSCYVTVVQSLDGIIDIEPKVDPVELLIDDDYLVMTLNSSQSLGTSFLPENAEVIPIVWKSSDENVAIVDYEGHIQAVGVGECRINGYTLNGLECGCTVKVVTSVIMANSISIQPEEVGLDIGESLQLTCLFSPDDASDKRVEWSSENTEIAVVDQTGMVTKLAKGSCRICAKTMDGSNLDAFCKINDKELTVSATAIPIDAVLDIYDVSGYRIIAGGNINQLRYLSPGVYIIVIDGQSYKIMK